jgi:hypothetical protein
MLLYKRFYTIRPLSPKTLCNFLVLVLIMPCYVPFCKFNEEFIFLLEFQLPF